MNRLLRACRPWVAAIALLVFASVPTSSAFAATTCGISNIVVSGNTATATIDLVGVVGTEFIIKFDSVQNLTPASLGLCARLAGPLQMLGLMARMPDNGLIGSLQVAVPIIITVEPPAALGLTFTNTYRAELHTHLLGYTINSPFRLYKSPKGGKFYDITNEVAPGSVRARGRTGGFSDFIIVLDLIPSADRAEDKYDYLAMRIENTKIPVPLRNALRSDLAASRAAFNGGNDALALYLLTSFRNRVAANAGTNIPNRWRAQRDLDNIAGDLIGYAESLDFSIRRAANE